MGRAISQIFCALAALAMALPAAASADPLRVWVMHNEPAERLSDLSTQAIEAELDAWRRDHGIIIENNVTNLALPTESTYPLASYVMKDNGFLDELARFKESEGGGEIAVEFIRWDDALNRLRGVLESGGEASAPDVIQIGSTWTASFADDGLIVDLSDRFAPSDFFPPSADSASLDGRLFAVPWFVDLRPIFYHRALVKDPALLETWAGFRQACEAYSSKGDRKFTVMPLAQNWNLLHNLAPWLWSAGGGIIETEDDSALGGEDVVLDSEASVDAAIYLKSLAASGCMDFPDVTQDVADHDFLDGKYAAEITGTWITSRMGEGWEKRFGVALPPAGPGGSRPFVGGSHLAITSASRARGNLRRALDLVAHLQGIESQKRYSGHTGFLPARRDAFGDDGAPAVFARALEAGRSYPSTPEWGKAVEEGLVRSHIWHIWRDIAQVASDATIRNTMAGASAKLRDSLAASKARRALPYAAGALAAMVALAIWIMAAFRRRIRRQRDRLERIEGELHSISAERRVLEAKAIVLERSQSERGAIIEKLEGRIEDLTRRAEELESMRSRQARGGLKDADDFSISSSGELRIADEPLCLDNARQARRFLEHAIRRLESGARSVHCLWGFALFDWRAADLKSNPVRLFDTMAAKINGALKSMGIVPLVGRESRGSRRFKLLWSDSALLAGSDVHGAAERAERAAEILEAGDESEALQVAVEALEFDAKNLEALAAVKRIESRGGLPDSCRGHIGTLLRIGEKSLAAECERLRMGAAELEGMLEGEPPAWIERDELESELREMVSQREYLEGMAASIFRAGGAIEERSAMSWEIVRRMQAVSQEIRDLVSRGIDREELWASVAGSANFSQVMAVPRIRSMVNNFYNEEIGSREDPRLIQLAMISMLSKGRIDEERWKASTDGELIGLIGGELRKELASLESYISAIS